VQRYWPELVPLIQAGRLHPERFVTNVMPLSEGAEAYRLFDAREAGALKMVMTA
jgi:threonine dehydrogenase-like Zn-dependent dehydrogenase